jgi:hypothetical protein
VDHHPFQRRLKPVARIFRKGSGADTGYGTAMTNERQWLHAEQSGQEELSERMFARLVAEMPSIEPSADFLDRTVRAAWQARTRRRLIRRVTLIAAALLMSIGGVGAIYELTGLATSLIARATVMFSRGLVWFMTSAAEGARWWWIAERIGIAARDTLAAPSAAASIAAIEMLALLAIYAFARLLAEDLQRYNLRQDEYDN